VPKWQEVEFDYRPIRTPEYVTVVLDPDDEIAEITDANNVFTALVGGRTQELAPPVLLAFEPSSVAPGDSLDAVGRSFRDPVAVLESEIVSSNLAATYVGPSRLSIQVASDAPEGTYLVSVRNPDGQTSNIMPLTVSSDEPPPTPTGQAPTARIFLPATFRNE
jgi:hypothetical protein